MVSNQPTTTKYYQYYDQHSIENGIHCKNLSKIKINLIFQEGLPLYDMEHQESVQFVFLSIYQILFLFQSLNLFIK